MTSLLTTIDKHGHSVDEIRWWSVNDHWCTWSEFETLLDKRLYDMSDEHQPALWIVSSDWCISWSSQRETPISHEIEGWVFKTPPLRQELSRVTEKILADSKVEKEECTFASCGAHYEFLMQLFPLRRFT